ncbi:hypothetical protein SAMN02745223_02926 [Devosia limi DSM 17137]|uniref:Uncharacterized protein n=1 Tax=Devosia limi DSM 17137 TaxID=1121477 RepID=A0A1M5CHY6_9HYPH|nr:hypothetical protein SAMN02745223_02926 [Devosia limi DSM 17137]
MAFMNYRRFGLLLRPVALIALLLTMTLLLGLPGYHAAPCPAPNGFQAVQSVDGHGRIRGAVHGHSLCPNEQLRSEKSLTATGCGTEYVRQAWPRTDSPFTKMTLQHPLDRPPISA